MSFFFRRSCLVGSRCGLRVRGCHQEVAGGCVVLGPGQPGDSQVRADLGTVGNGPGVHCRQDEVLLRYVPQVHVPSYDLEELFLLLQYLVSQYRWDDGGHGVVGARPSSPGTQKWPLDPYLSLLGRSCLGQVLVDDGRGPGLGEL